MSPKIDYGSERVNKSSGFHNVLHVWFYLLCELRFLNELITNG